MRVKTVLIPEKFELIYKYIWYKFLLQNYSSIQFPGCQPGDKNNKGWNINKQATNELVVK
jgi:hypothetical protein